MALTRHNAGLAVFIALVFLAYSPAISFYGSACDAALTRARRARSLRGIYVILNEQLEMLDTCHGGARRRRAVLQYRAKSGIVPERLRALRLLARERDAVLIVNDDWRAAKAFDCDGVHLGPDDSGFGDVDEVRFNLPDALIGLSCGTIEEITRAKAADVDYARHWLPSFRRLRKPTPAHRSVSTDCARSPRRRILPVAAIGGITVQNVADVRATGVAMAAVISALSAARDPRSAAGELVAAWGGGSAGGAP